MTRTPKQHKCRNAACGELFTRQRMGQIACCIGCAIIVGKDKLRAEMEKAAKIERKDLAARKEAIKPRSKWLAEAQAAFNSWVRARDAQMPCISCGHFHLGAHDAGHYRSVGSMPALRFHADNCHRQCVPCNQHKAGNVVEYRIRLVARIGVERVAFLEGPHEPAKYTIDDAKAIKAEYKEKLKGLFK